MMFQRAVAAIHASMHTGPPLPTGVLDSTLRWLFRLLNGIPNQKLRSTMTFTIFRFAERVTIFANQMVQSMIPRRQSLINQVWAYHALDEARHVAFDAMILERNCLWRPLRWIPRALAVPCCIWLSMLLNANEIWIARQLGLATRWWHLPGLMRRTTVPFKRRVFGLLVKTVLGGDGAGKVLVTHGNDQSRLPEPSGSRRTRVHLRLESSRARTITVWAMEPSPSIWERWSRCARSIHAASAPSPTCRFTSRQPRWQFSGIPRLMFCCFASSLGFALSNLSMSMSICRSLRKIGDRWITFIGTIRNAASKTLAEIQEQLTAYQRCPPEESFAIRRFCSLIACPFG